MQRFKNILVVCGAHADEEAAERRAIWLAQANDARITFVDVEETEKSTLERLAESLPFARRAALTEGLREARISRLDTHVARAQAAGISADSALLSGAGFVEIIRRVLRDGHDIVIKTAEGADPMTLFHGIDLHLMRKCPCPVWMLKPGESGNVSRILAALDPEPDDPERDALSQIVMELSLSLADRTRARVDVINTWRLQEEQTLRGGRFKLSDEEIDQVLDEERRQSAERLNRVMARFPGVASKHEVRHIKGWAGDVIPAYAAEKEIDTVVMGTVGRTGVSGFFIGNTAETILNKVACSVLAVKPPGFVSPVSIETS